MKKKIGFITAILGLILSIYIAMGILGVVPIKGVFWGESLVRFLAQCNIICYLISAWAYWEI